VKPCEWCDNTFKPNVSYQVYCSPECRTAATKIKIAERYVFNQRKKRQFNPKYCVGGCGTKLSIYNDSQFCDNCSINQKEVNKTLKEIKGFMNGKIQFDE
jgi:hypothetical protein